MSRRARLLFVAAGVISVSIALVEQHHALDGVAGVPLAPLAFRLAMNEPLHDRSGAVD